MLYVSDLRTTIGSTLLAWGASFCNRALTPVMTNLGLRDESRKRHKTSMRLPIVSMLGLTRSKGSVSQAGNRTMSCGETKLLMSAKISRAAVPVGAAITIGCRDVE